MDETNKSVKIAIIGHGNRLSKLSEAIVRNITVNYIESDVQSNNIYDNFAHTTHVDKVEDSDFFKKTIILVEDSQDGNIISNILAESFRHNVYDATTLYNEYKRNSNSGYKRPRKNHKYYC